MNLRHGHKIIKHMYDCEYFPPNISQCRVYWITIQSRLMSAIYATAMRRYIQVNFRLWTNSSERRMKLVHVCVKSTVSHVLKNYNRQNITPHRADENFVTVPSIVLSSVLVFTLEWLMRILYAEKVLSKF